MQDAAKQRSRDIALVLVLLAFAFPAMAADPIVGTWSLNIPKSQFSPVLAALTQQQPPKQRTETYREIEGNQIEFSSTQLEPTGRPFRERCSGPCRAEP